MNVREKDILDPVSLGPFEIKEQSLLKRTRESQEKQAQQPRSNLE